MVAWGNCWQGEPLRSRRGISREGELLAGCEAGEGTMNRAPTMVRPAANEDSTWCCPYLDTGYVVTRSRPYPRQGANEDSTWCCPYLLLQDRLEERQDFGGGGVVGLA